MAPAPRAPTPARHVLPGEQVFLSPQLELAVCLGTRNPNKLPSIFHTTPDYRRLLTALQGGIPDRVQVYEFFSDTAVQTAALGDWSPFETLGLCA